MLFRYTAIDVQAQPLCWVFYIWHIGIASIFTSTPARYPESNSEPECGMSEKEIARIDAAMNNLANLMREQSRTLNKVPITLTKTQSIQVSNSKRIDKLESDKIGLVRLIFGPVIAVAVAALKVM